MIGRMGKRLPALDAAVESIRHQSSLQNYVEAVNYSCRSATMGSMRMARHAVKKLAVKLAYLCAFRISLRGKRNVHGQDVIWTEAGIGFEQLDEAANQKTPDLLLF